MDRKETQKRKHGCFFFIRSNKNTLILSNVDQIPLKFQKQFLFFIEHPELIAQRIERMAKRIGREQLIAGSDCGFGTWVGQAAVEPEIVWAKLAALTEGARIASEKLWK